VTEGTTVRVRTRTTDLCQTVGRKTLAVVDGLPEEALN
jgi:hypothetical protein